MILQSTDELEEYVGNKYSLVILAAKRSRQLREGHVPLARDPSPNYLTLAIREIEERKIQSVAPPEEELPPAPREMITSLVAGADFLDGEEPDPDEGDAIDALTALLASGGINVDDDDEDVDDDQADGGTHEEDLELDADGDDDDDNLDGDESGGDEE